MEDVIVCTISADGTKESNEMVVKTARNIKDSGFYHIASHAGNKNGELARGLESICNEIKLTESKSISNLVKSAIKDAINKQPKAIVYMEGDKYTFVPYMSELVNQIIRKELDVCVASRSLNGYFSFPPIQYMVEGMFNIYASARLGYFSDYVYGPKAFSQETAKFILDYKYDDWGILIYPIMRAKKEGYKIGKISVPGYSPEDYMKKYSFQSPLAHFKWRMHQFKGNINGLKI